MAKKKTDIPTIRLTLERQDGIRKKLKFQERFQIGRDESCEIQIPSPGISRVHAEVYFRNGYWWLKDLNSANGSYVLGRRVDEIPLGKSTRVELGLGDAILTFKVEGFSPQSQTVVKKPPSVTQVAEHYFGDEDRKEMGDHTRLIRSAFQTVQKKERLKYFYILAGMIIIAGGIAFYSFLQHQAIERQKKVAEKIFYAMKEFELELAAMQNKAVQEQDSTVLEKISQQRRRAQEMARNYDQFLDELHFYDDSKWSETDRVILHVARLFGECEVSMPREFMNEVYRYIKRWKTTDRLQKALDRAIKNNYHKTVAEVMLDYDLPPQYFYLGLQESSYKLETIGPRTRFGIAKGIWQFIPPTASRYGLQTGPLVGLRKYDPRDDRFNFNKSTHAAARYIRDIYETEAQASGLLVIASYNWGEGNIRELVRKLPANPQERNFWQLLKRYRKEIPRQTYDYVFYIVSAAVIGENPQLFGFDFENPFATVVS